MARKPITLEDLREEFLAHCEDPFFITRRQMAFLNISIRGNVPWPYTWGTFGLRHLSPEGEEANDRPRPPKR
jgi:hypothetical protein